MRRVRRTTAIRPVGSVYLDSLCDAFGIDLPSGGSLMGTQPIRQGTAGIKPRAISRNRACSGQLVGR
jgi:hypothetical protein